MKRIVLPSFSRNSFSHPSDDILALLSYSPDQAGHPPHLHPLPGFFISPDLRWNLGILHGVSHGPFFWKCIGLLHLLQTPYLFYCAIFQRTILSGGVLFPIPFRFHLCYIRGNSHLDSYERFPIHPSWKPLSLVLHFPSSPIIFHGSCHPAPFFPFSKGVIVIISSTREGNEGKGIDHDGIKYPEDGGLQRKV